jgi:hypothetical protein
MIAAALALAARHGRALLIAGLVVGIAFPPLAAVVRPHVAELVAVLLALSAFRIGWRQAVGALGDLRLTLAVVVVTQLAAPLVVLGAEHAFGLGGPLATAFLLMMVSAPIAGTPNLTVMTGGDPAPALRLLIIATALLPVTSLPVFALMPAIAAGSGVAAATLKLAAIIAGASAVGFAARAMVGRRYGVATQAGVDGLSALAMALVVIGLMEAIGLTLRADPAGLTATLAFAFAANFGCQIVGAVVARRAGLRDEVTSYGISLGNRNFVLLLAALPAGVMEPLLLFIGCYQLPMYMTPLLLRGLYRRLTR